MTDNPNPPQRQPNDAASAVAHAVAEKGNGADLSGLVGVALQKAAG